jgi:superfamily II DNA or RNA helicase
MILRSYQEIDVGHLRTACAAGAARTCYQSPTGSGKTVLFTHIVRGAAARENRVAILGHRQEVVDQISDALDELGLAHGFIAAGYEEDSDAQVQIASVATVVRRGRPPGSHRSSRSRRSPPAARRPSARYKQGWVWHRLQELRGGER